MDENLTARSVTPQARLPAYGRTTLGVLFLLVFAKTVPLGLATDALPAIFRSNGLALDRFWLFGLLWLPWLFKPLVAPLLDRYGNRRFGLRKSWLLPATLGAATLYATLAFIPPQADAVVIIVIVIMSANVVMAVQDIALDAYCVESLNDQNRAYGTGLITLGWRMGTLVASAGLLMVYDEFGWFVVPILACLIMLACTAPVFFRPEPLRNRPPPPGGYMTALISVLRRRETPVILLLTGLMGLNYGLHWGVSSALLVDLGFSLTEIGIVISIAYIVGLTVATVVTGKLVSKFGAKRAAVVALLLVPAGSAPFIYVAAAEPGMVTVIVAYTLGMMLTGTAYIVTDAARLEWARGRQAATDYSVQSLAYTAGMGIGTAIGGPLAAWVGWTGYRVIDAATLATAIGVYLLIHDRVSAAVDARICQEQSG